jgi:hypothetical protein
MRHRQGIGAAESNWRFRLARADGLEEAVGEGRFSMLTPSHFKALFLLLLLGAAPVAEAQVQPELAKRYFEEATKLCERDAGRLWGVSLCGPMVIFDPVTKTRATSQPEPEGPPPRFPGYADGIVSWGGLQWFAWPLWLLPENSAEARQQIMLHGLFHRIQPELAFMQGMLGDGSNEHLDTLEGRFWMKLEWRALRRAVASSGSGRAEAIADVLAFRRERRRLFPGAAENERLDEIREGLADYTGVAAWANSPADARRAAAAAAAAGESQPSLVGNFESHSGPAYGVLLDDLLPGWRRHLRATSDLGELLASATKRPPTTDLAKAAARYDGATLRTAEEARDRAQKVHVAELRRRFVDGPVLTMPAGAAGPATPGTASAFRRSALCFSTISPFPRNGAGSTPTTASCALPMGPGCPFRLRAARRNHLAGDGWSANLNPGWVVRPAARPGSFVIVREN